MMFQLATFPAADPLTIFGPRTPWIETAASMFMLCSTAIRWLSQAISGHGAYISQDNRLIFLNNSLILAKGWSARLSRRRRWDFRPARGKPAALARARLIGGKLEARLLPVESPVAQINGIGRIAEIEDEDVVTHSPNSPAAAVLTAWKRLTDCRTLPGAGQALLENAKLRAVSEAPSISAPPAR